MGARAGMLFMTLARYQRDCPCTTWHTMGRRGSFKERGLGACAPLLLLAMRCAPPCCPGKHTFSTSVHWGYS